MVAAIQDQRIVSPSLICTGTAGFGGSARWCHARPGFRWLRPRHETHDEFEEFPSLAMAKLLRGLRGGQSSLPRSNTPRLMRPAHPRLVLEIRLVTGRTSFPAVDRTSRFAPVATPW